MREDGVWWIAMEYLAGVTLDRMIAGRSLTLQIVMKYALEIADALIAAHAAGIIHRDLKLGNIIITEDGRTKLLDFGLAQFCDAVSPPAETETRTLHTMPGTILGTPAYMSPEQAQGRPLDARSDIFAFGLVVYEM
ncbi:MAG TPA: serine/threonine-protein kinase, partial [Bryobacteraceae bacterium]|nr:serine/threonine-protein kinase [Bryobacteraceae bacterium]